MPPFSRNLDEEGVRFINFRLIEGQGLGRAGRFREAELLALLTGGPHPARNPTQNVADLRAQVAANEKGREELLRMVEQFGLDVVQAYMRHVQDNAEESVRRVITRLTDGAVRVPPRQRRRHPGAASAVDRERRGATDRLHRNDRRSCRTISMRRAPCASLRCCTCSARWSTTRSR